MAHFERQSARDARLVPRVFRYNALLDGRHDLPTRSVVVLLRPDADGPELTGRHRRGIPGEPDHLAFDDRVLRLWRQPVDLFLDGGLGTVPLAPVADLAGRPVEDVVRAMGQRLDQAPPELNGLLWISAALPMGLRHPAELIRAVLSGARHMKESTMYQSILAEGEARGKAQGEARGEVLQSQRLLIRQGQRRFGPMPAADRARVEAIGRLDRLEALFDLVSDAPGATWADFWAAAGPEPDAG